MKNLLLILFSFAMPCLAQSGTTAFGATAFGVTFMSSAAPAATPTFSPVAGTYSSTQSVTISTASSGCSGYVFWNLTGTSMSSGTQGTSVSVASTETVYAQVIGCPGYANSVIGSAAYTIGAATPAILQSNVNSADGVMTVALPSHAAGGASCVFSLSDIVVTAISNTAGFTWASYPDTTDTAGGYMYTWCAPKSAYASTDTVTVTSSANHMHLLFVDVSIVTAVDNSLIVDQGGYGIPASGNLTISGTNDLVFSFITTTGGSTNPAGWTSLTASAGSSWNNDSSYSVVYKTATVSPVSATYGAYVSLSNLIVVALK
jgi:hypothetical protein